VAVRVEELKACCRMGKSRGKGTWGAARTNMSSTHRLQCVVSVRVRAKGQVERNAPYGVADTVGHKVRLGSLSWGRARLGANSQHKGGWRAGRRTNALEGEFGCIAVDIYIEPPVPSTRERICQSRSQTCIDAAICCTVIMGVRCQTPGADGNKQANARRALQRVPSAPRGRPRGSHRSAQVLGSPCNCPAQRPQQPVRGEGRDVSD